MARKNMQVTHRNKRAEPKAHDYRDVLEKIVPVDSLPPMGSAAIYGTAGSGKTTLAATWPKPILFIDCNERGTDSVRDIKDTSVIRAQTWQDVIDVMWGLIAGDKKLAQFKTIVVDTVSQAQDLAMKHVMEEKGKSYDEFNLGANRGKIYQADWGVIGGEMRRFIIPMSDFDKIHATVVFIAHDRTFSGEDDETNTGVIAPQVGPRLMPSVESTLLGAVSIVGNTFIRETVTKSTVRKKTVRKRQTQYCLRIGPNAYYKTKIRKPQHIELPEVLVEPSYGKIMALIETSQVGAKPKRKTTNGKSQVKSRRRQTR